MANINFYLKTGKPNKNGEKSIILRITFEQKRSIIFINKMVQPKHWNAKKQSVKPPTQREPENNYEDINETIKIYKEKAGEAIRHALKKSIPLSDAFFKNYFGNKYIKPDDRSFFEWFDEYISSSKSSRAVRTITGYTTVSNFLKDFEKYTNQFIYINGIDMLFFDSLKNYAFIKRKINDNYFAKIINVLKSFLNWLADRGVDIPPYYNKFAATEREKEIIFLTIDELMHLYNYEFEQKRHVKARDIYCFGCFTGLRISDIFSLKREHIKEDEIHKTIVKTRRTDIIPLNRFAKQILEKYKTEETPLPKISSQKLNDYIKECCRKAEIKTSINIVTFIGGKPKEKSYPKWELITTHTARKTFLTNSIILGMNYMAARGISGHKKDKDFNKYVKIAEDFKKKEMQKTWDALDLKKNK